MIKNIQLNSFIGLFCAFTFSNVNAQQALFIPSTLSGSSISLDIQQGAVNFLPGNSTPTFGYNGNFLGPTILLNKNDSVNFNITNNLQDISTVHWHGLHVAPENDGSPHQEIMPSQVWSPSFKIRNNASTFWYHSHVHMSTEYQVNLGLAGLIIVHDSTEASYVLPRTYGIDDFPIIIQSKSFDILNQLAAFTHDDSIMMINGTIDPVLDAPAQVVRFRCLNGSADRTYNLGLSTNANFYVIASDGGMLDQPISANRVRLSPGERYELLIDLTVMQGQSLYLMSYASQLQNGIIGSPQVGNGMAQLPGYAMNPLNGADFNLLKIDVVAQTTNPVTTIPVQFQTNVKWLVQNADTSRILTFAPEVMGPQQMVEGPFTISGKSFDMDSINIHIPFNNTEIWSIVNNTMVAHPFHIHDIQFNVVDRNGVAVTGIETGWKDVVLVRPQETVRVIAKFETFYNDNIPYMYHCHLLHHEDEGMMGSFIVNSPASTGINSNIYNDIKVELYPNPVGDILYTTIPKGADFVIYNSTGQVIEYYEKSFLEDKLVVHTSSFVNGMYFIQVKTPKGIIVKKFVK
jgi:blue copper oxidase